MRRTRVIPVLLIQEGGLVKSVKFNHHKYVGDPINAVRIFNEKEVDEICILDISATKSKREPDIAMISDITSEAFMPLSYGGGITTLAQIESLLYIGVEKVILNKSALLDEKLVIEASKQFGAQSIVISIDVKKNWLGQYKVYSDRGSRDTGLIPVDFAKRMEDIGAGELLINAIDHDGTYKGYDTAIIEKIANMVDIPVIACGGAGSLSDFSDAIAHGASAVAAGSMFVFQRPHQAVLISYPTQIDLVTKVFNTI
jgi:cyclase